MYAADLGNVILGTIALFMGIAACLVGVIHRGNATKALLWFALFSGLYGARLFASTPIALTLLAGPLSPYAGIAISIITYIILIPAALFWIEMSFGTLRRIFQVLTALAIIVAIAGLASMLITRSLTQFMPLNNLLVICVLLILAIAEITPQISRKYLAIQSPVLIAGTIIFAAAVLEANLRTFIRLPYYPFFEPVAFTLFVFSQGWVAAENVFRDQRRLIAIEEELAVAREIQNSILPSGVPEVNRLRISAAYSPMTAVAGDFYWFISVDPYRIGLLVADVSGHGVPAALIASMIKVAMQSVVHCADDPGAVLQGLDRVLSGQLRGQFVSAAYLWLDTEARKGLYSAAGHPPLLRWNHGSLERIESNGLILGVIPESEYPVREIPISPGDRYLLYTDGVMETENAKGEAFGDRKFEEVVCANHLRSSADLSDRLLAELRSWRATSTQQQDDITLIIVDVV